MQIRRIEEPDIDAVVTLIARNLREVNSREYPADYIEANVRSHDRDVILDRMKNAHMYVACEGGAVLGCGAIQGYYGSKTESVLLTIFVLPERHGQGIGRIIMRALENDEYALRASRIELAASVTACGFYRKLGYGYKGGERTLGKDGCIRLEKVRDRA